MTIGQLLRGTRHERSETEMFLSVLLNKTRSWIFAHPDHQLTDTDVETLHDWQARRAAHEPVAYILKRKEFYSRMFSVDHRVLIPRPSTEELVSLTLDFLRTGENETRTLDTGIVGVARALGDISAVQTIVDVGTGSGCIAITLAHELPQMQLIATDISSPALTVAKRNAEEHGLTDRIEFRQGNALESVTDLTEPFLVVSNPPYIPKNERLMDDVQKYEPPEALRGGSDGTFVLKRIMQSAKDNPACMGFVLECRTEQVPAEFSE